MANFRVHKFGGTSVGTSERLLAVSELVRTFPSVDRHVIVVSALSGVTDQLLKLVEDAQTSVWKNEFDQLTLKHEKVWKEISVQLGLTPERVQEVIQPIRQEFQDLHDLLHAIHLAKTASVQQAELISGFGELWSSRMLAGILGSLSSWIDARRILVVEEGELGVLVHWEKSKANLDRFLKQGQDPVVVTGFIASNEKGIPTTLKRNGSDYSATIFANLLDAKDVTIWKEVDGILSANPKWVPAAQVLDEISYQEAAELAYFGAKVLHPSTMAPAIRKKIPIYIRNSFDPNKPGTKIHGNAKSIHPVKGFTTIDDISLINVEGTGMLGVPGVASRLFGSLKEANISVVLISQASSEHSICFAVPENQAEKARVVVEKAFKFEISEGLIQEIEKITSCSILAMVGDRMADQRGVAARLFRDLSRANVNIKAIAQGSSERNISVVIAKDSVPKALQAAHSGFTLSRQIIPIALIGPGNIGLTFLNQIQRQLADLEGRFSAVPKLVAIANSKEMLLSHEDLGFSWNKEKWNQAKKVPVDLYKMIDHIQSEGQPHPVWVDCTADQAVAKIYPEVLQAGIHVITPNKKAGSGNLDLYRRISRTASERSRHFFYEATVGAGLPVITTLQDLIRTGDQIQRIEGILSGTLAYVFSELSDQKSFSEVVNQARQNGYTEPDPRDDLSGMDVARKLVILARESGFQLEVDEIQVETLVPVQLQSVSVDEFMRRLSESDSVWKKKYEDAKANHEVLRYVGKLLVQSGKVEAKVKLEAIDRSQLLGQSSGTDNVFVFTTHRYYQHPLMIRGPGAGAEVTAAGVFADLIRLIGQTGGGNL